MNLILLVSEERERSYLEHGGEPQRINYILFARDINTDSIKRKRKKWVAVAEFIWMHYCFARFISSTEEK